MKLFKQPLQGLLLLLVSLPALADDVTYSTIRDAAENSSDLSRQALVTIFGDVVTSPFTATDTTVIGSLFGILNGVICAIALFWFLTVTLKSIVKAGNAGKVFGSTRTAMAPLMSFVGFITLVPTSSGWSLSQLIMLWAASIMGVGSANLLTNKAVDMMNDGYSLVTQPVASSTRDAAQQIFEMNLCKYAINEQLSGFYDDAGSASTSEMSTSGSDGSYETSNGSAYCGTAKIPTTTRSSSWSVLFDSDVDTDAIVSAQKSALDTMQTTLDSAAQTFVSTYISKRDDDSGTLTDVETTIQNAATAYENTINSALSQIDYEDTLQSSLSSNMKTYGWIALGAWYQTFATANAKTTDVGKSAPTVSGPTGLGEMGNTDLYQQVFTAYNAQLQNSSYTATLGIQTSKKDIETGRAKDPKSVFVGLFNSPMQQLTNWFATQNIGQVNDDSDQLNPLIQMKTIGDYTLDTVGTALTFGAMRERFLSPLGIPCQKPPFGTMSAVDLKTGKLVWQVPVGTVEDTGPLGIRMHMPIPIGMPTLGASLATQSGLLFFAGTQDFYLRAFDTANGKEIWKSRLPVGSQSGPMTYVSPKTGKQYIIINAGGARQSPDRGDYIIAYALPDHH